MGSRLRDGGRPNAEKTTGAPRRAAWRSRRLTLPAWLLSLVLHTGLFVVVLLIWRQVPTGAVAEPGREVGIVIARHDDAGDFYEGENAAADAESATGDATDELLEDQPPLDPTDVLPTDAPIIGPGLTEPGRRLSSEGMQQGSSASASAAAALSGGAAHTKVFNLEGTGYKFVYVFDRSGSMGIRHRAPLRAAKAEMLASLESLDKVHQFQIIFYNERPTIMQLAERPGGLVFGNERNKLLARQFIAGIVADGATRHEDALVMALRMQPDVIFFLTDGDDSMNSGSLARVRRMNAGRASIHAIEFGRGPSISSDNFIMQLARENGGGYAYVDVTRLRLER